MLKISLKVEFKITLFSKIYLSRWHLCFPCHIYSRAILPPLTSLSTASHALPTCCRCRSKEEPVRNDYKARKWSKIDYNLYTTLGCWLVQHPWRTFRIKWALLAHGHWQSRKSKWVTGHSYFAWVTGITCRGCKCGMWIKDSSMLEKTSKITVNLKLPIPPVNPVPKCHVYKSIEYLQRWWLTPSLGSFFRCLTTLRVNKFFLISYLNIPWHNLRSLPRMLSLFLW